MAKTQVTRIHDGSRRALTPRERRALAAEDAATVDLWEEDTRGNIRPVEAGRDIFDTHRGSHTE